MFEERYPGIFVYENFLTNFEISALFSYLNDDFSKIDWDRSTKEFFKILAEDMWPTDKIRQDYFIDTSVKNTTKAKSSIVAVPLKESEFFKSISEKLNFYGFPNMTPKGYMGVVKRYTAGGYLGEHRDDENNSDIKSAINFYINDDYEGGELYFKNKDILFKPNSNSLVVFSGNADYTHEVKPVKGDVPRYNITLTTKHTTNYFIDLVPNWS